jgi:enterochelin esterase-like enzyme
MSGADWIDPVKTGPAGTHYKLFATPSRGVGTEASYLIYLPAEYDLSGERRYPVLYWLHGGGGSQREGGWMVKKLDARIRAGKIPPFIIVLVQGLADVRYINSKDHTRPVEDVIIKDLVPHIDSTYRTLATREGRALEGMSMGGYGALRLGFKYPDLFGTVSALAPSILEDMNAEPPVVREPFGNDQVFWDEVGPWNIVKKNANAIAGRTRIRILVGDKDDRLLGPVTKFHNLLRTLKIDHQFLVIPGAEHRYDQLIEKAPVDALAFWGTASPVE